MGKSSLIIVLGMSIIISFFILKLNANSTENTSVTSSMFQKTQARLIANSAVEIYLEKLKNDASMMDSEFKGNNLFGGTYNMAIQGPEDCVQVTAIASFMDETHTTVVEAAVDKLPVNHPPGALYLSSNIVSKLTQAKSAIKGKITIDGRNHTTSGELIEPVVNMIPGIAVDGSEQKQDVINLYNDMTQSSILGLGGNPSIEVVSNNVDWAQYGQLLADNADISLTSTNIQGSGPWGTEADPKVTFIKGDVKIDNRITQGGNAGGCGILIIDGSMQINAIFEFKGLVIAYKDTGFELQLNGNAKVIGGMVVAGESINIKAITANFEILYSYDIIQKVQQLLKTKRFEILSWWE